jgi:hypothetical protein
LSNKGERLLLRDAFGAVVLDVTYSDEGSWPVEADGQGWSLVALNGDPNSPASWRKSTLAGGSPGAPDPLPVLINEVQLDAASGRVAAVELYNPTGEDADVSGWILSTGRTSLPVNWSDAPAGLRLPAGSIVPAGGYWVANVLDANSALNVSALRLGLFSAAASGRLSGYAYGARLAIPANGATLGRTITTDGREHFAIQSSPTLGAANAAPLDPPVLISRLAANVSSGPQWVEIANASAAPMSLYDPLSLTSGWQLDGLFYQFPGGVELPAGGRVLLTSAEPSDVCLSGALPAGVRVLGPLQLPLAANAMALTLAQPTLWGDGMAAGELDRVYYRNEAPWPYRAADSVLSRTWLGGFGSEPANWQAVTGSGFVAPGAAPTTPVDLAAATNLCSFDAFVNRSGQLEIRWVATAQRGTVAFRLLRSPLISPESKTVVATQPVTAAQAGIATLVQLIDADADPGQQYVYWLQTVTANNSTREVAFTTLRAELHQVYAPFVAP